MKFRSKFEMKVYNNSLKGTRAQYESIRIPFFKMHSYKPDFLLPNGIIVEIKGRFTAVDRAKHLAIKKQQPELDIRFVFAYDNKLFKASSTRYSVWCDKHGFKYAFKKVPEEWLKEKKKKVNVLDVDTLMKTTT